MTLVFAVQYYLYFLENKVMQKQPLWQDFAVLVSFVPCTCPVMVSLAVLIKNLNACAEL